MKETPKRLSEWVNTQCYPNFLGPRYISEFRVFQIWGKQYITLLSQSDLGKKQFCDMNMNIHSKVG